MMEPADHHTISFALYMGIFTKARPIQASDT